MRWLIAAAGIALSVGCITQCIAAQEDQPLPGSPQFKPSPDQPVGWRGDGSGRFPAADGPLTWGRQSIAIKELGFQAKKPKPEDKGQPMGDGVIREWLTLGPVPVPEGKTVKDDFGTDEASLAPDEGDKSGALEWTAAKLDTSFLNFWPMYNQSLKDPKGFVAYAHSWVYSAEGKPVFLNVMFSGTSKIWLNGKDLGTKDRGSFDANGSHVKLALVKGWNRILLRVSPLADLAWPKGINQWHFNNALFGTEKDEYETKNILWSTPMPDNGPGVGSPILVGDKLLAVAEAGHLVCIDAKAGKVLWARSSTFADAATPEERTKDPQIFAETDPLTAKVQAALQAYCDAPAKYVADAKSRNERMDLERKINKLVQDVDREKYEGQSGSEAGESATTPVSDGQSVWAVYGSGVVACFDLEGNRKWTIVIPIKHSEHGYCSTPCLVDGKLVVKSSGYLGAVALDAKTGAVVTPMPLWKAKGLAMYSSPLPVLVGKEKLIVQSFAVINQLSDGKVVSKTFTPPYYNIYDYVSPAIEGRTICSKVLAKKDGNHRFVFQTLPDEMSDGLTMKQKVDVEYDVKAFPCWFSYDHCASPLLYQGLAYILSVDGVLTVIDSATGEIVYQKLLDLSPMMVHGGIVRAGCSVSPTLAGKYIYIWDNQGSTLIIEPGRQFKPVGRNRLENLWFRYGPERNECTTSNPVFSGNRLYYRGEVNLYCIGVR
jgi:outer membrane protein assembly factor BamB